METVAQKAYPSAQGEGLARPVPASVKGDAAIALYRDVNDARAAIKSIAFAVDDMRDRGLDAAALMPRRTGREVPANITLAYRSLEDASMRLGKALQALDNGDSVYDRATTVGA